MLCAVVDGGEENTGGLSCSEKPLAQTNRACKAQFLQIKRGNKTSIACDVDQLELWQRELSIAVSEVRSRILQFENVPEAEVKWEWEGRTTSLQGQGRTKDASAVERGSQGTLRNFSILRSRANRVIAFCNDLARLSP